MEGKNEENIVFLVVFQTKEEARSDMYNKTEETKPKAKEVYGNSRNQMIK